MNPFKRFTKSAQEIRLTDAERSAMRGNLRAFMAEHPAGAPLILSPYERFIGIASTLASGSLRAPVLALALLLIVGAGSATALAAEGALPGDALYPVKVSIIEPVAGAFQVSPEAKAEWNTGLAETRLNEAEQLAVRSDLTPVTQAKLAESFNTSVAAANTDINAVAEKNPAAAANLKLALNLSLTSHGETLAGLIGDASSPNAGEVLALAENVGSKVRGGGEAATAPVAAATAPASASAKVAAPMKPAKPFVPMGFKAMSIAAASSTVEAPASIDEAARAEAAIQALRASLAATAGLDASTTAHIEATLNAAEENVARAGGGSKPSAAAEAYFERARVLTDESRLLLQLATSTFQFDAKADADATSTTSLAAPPVFASPPAVTVPPPSGGTSVSGSSGTSESVSENAGGVVHSITSGLGL